MSTFSRFLHNLYIKYAKMMAIASRRSRLRRVWYFDSASFSEVKNIGISD